MRDGLKPDKAIISEFYQLRRTAIKDIASYLGFLVGFIGAAPFAWGLLAEQLDAGRFARGLWYFFGIVTAAGIFAGVAGLGLGTAAGLLWEQAHRHRRKSTARTTEAVPEIGPAEAAPASAAGTSEIPRLQLVSTGGSRSPTAARLASPVRLSLESQPLPSRSAPAEMSVRAAEATDVPVLSALMREFYAEAGYELSTIAASGAFAAVLRDPLLGRVLIMETDGEAGGFLVLSIAFSMEYGGLRGFVDDLFVLPRHRGKGLASLALAEARRTSMTLKLRALVVETSEASEAAVRVYRAAGFSDTGHMLMSMPLAGPVHET